MRPLLLAFAALVVAPTSAAAQAACPYGLVAVDGIHCCWPGQTFQVASGVCGGVPQCPSGLVPYEETCVAAPRPALAPAPAPPAVPAPVPAPQYSLPPAVPTPAPQYALPPAVPPPGPQYLQPVPAYAQPQLLAYPAKFVGRNGGSYTVLLDDGQTCQTPCSLHVLSGWHTVAISGDAAYRQKLEFPSTDTTVEIDRRRGGGWR